MVAITIGLAMLAGLATMFSNSTTAYSEAEKTSRQIENGRYAIDMLSQDPRHAGYYGQFSGEIVAPAALPDPCETASAANLYDALVAPVQVYSPNNLTAAQAVPGTCGNPRNFLTANDLAPGSDILVVRRTDTEALAAPPTLSDVYLQANPVEAEVQFGDPDGFSIGSLNADNTVAVVGTKASGKGVAATVLKKANVADANPVDPSPRLAADIRKYHTHIYFVAPCSVPKDGGAHCTGAADDGGRPIPTLKRLELTAGAGGATMTLVPLVEGVEKLQVDFGIDGQPNSVNPATGRTGDGVADGWVQAPTLLQLPDVVAARVHILARNTDPTNGYSDTKQYSLGLAGTTNAANDAFKRHAYTLMVRLVNLASRREIPQ